MNKNSKEYNEVEESILKLLKRARRPGIEDVGPLAKKLKITSARQLWELFDSIQKRWAEARSMESDDDLL